MTERTPFAEQPSITVPECCYGGPMQKFCVEMCTHAKPSLWPLVKAVQEANAAVAAAVPNSEATTYLGALITEYGRAMRELGYEECGREGQTEIAEQVASDAKVKLLSECGRVRASVSATAPSITVPVETHVEVRPCAVQEHPDAHTIWFVVGNQSFPIGSDYQETKAEAEWYAKMFCGAVRRMLEENRVGSEGKKPYPQGGNAEGL